MIEAFLGAAVGALTILVARLLRAERWLYSIGLLALPGLYACFALHGDVPAVALTEMTYGIPFLFAGVLFAAVSVRHSAEIVGALWVIHGMFDLIRSRLIENPGVPGWYPVWCCGVDVVVGAYLLWLSRRLVDANLRRA